MQFDKQDLDRLLNESRKNLDPNEIPEDEEFDDDFDDLDDLEDDLFDDDDYDYDDDIAGLLKDLADNGLY